MPEDVPCRCCCPRTPPIRSRRLTKTRVALVGFRGDGADQLTRAAIRAPSRAFPRRRALCTNSKKPRWIGSFSCEMRFPPVWAAVPGRDGMQDALIAECSVVEKKCPQTRSWAQTSDGDIER